MSLQNIKVTAKLFQLVPVSSVSPQSLHHRKISVVFIFRPFQQQSWYKIGHSFNLKMYILFHGTFCLSTVLDKCKHSPYEISNECGRYIESTYVPKIVTILIDTGFNMRNLYNGATNGETFGSKAIATAVKFLPTLRRDQDYISIVAFDASGNKPLNETMIYNGDDLLKSYNASLNVNIFQTKLITNATATSKAINTAISDLNSDSSSAPAHYLKVLIAF